MFRHMHINRKGIYQSFDPTGNVEADERWQVITLLDGSLQIDNETVRVAPFNEPRSDSMTMLLDPQLRLIEFTIHGLKGARESRVCILGEARDAATICWRHGARIHERRIAWREDIELDWATPLCNMATVWRSALAPGQSRGFDCYFLDPVTFKPTAMKQIYTRHADEQHATRFGALPLQHYTLDFGGDGTNITHFWCNGEGVLYDFVSPSGSFVLTAANVN
jgi:hypothetical protein